VARPAADAAAGRSTPPRRLMTAAAGARSDNGLCRGPGELDKPLRHRSVGTSSKIGLRQLGVYS
jgi:hypothetical protein